MEIILSNHAAEKMRLLMITVHQVQCCVTDPDRVRSAHLAGVPAMGLRFERDFDRGQLNAIVRQQGMAAFVVTVFWE